MRMYICTYIYIRTYIHIYVYVYIYIYTHLYVDIYVYVYRYTLYIHTLYVYVYVYTCMSVYIVMSLCMRVCKRLIFTDAARDHNRESGLNPRDCNPDDEHNLSSSHDQSSTHPIRYACMQVDAWASNIPGVRWWNSGICMRGGGLGSRPKKMYGERLGDGVEYHLMSPTPRR